MSPPGYKPPEEKHYTPPNRAVGNRKPGQSGSSSGSRKAHSESQGNNDPPAKSRFEDQFWAEVRAADQEKYARMAAAADERVKEFNLYLAWCRINQLKALRHADPNGKYGPGPRLMGQREARLQWEIAFDMEQGMIQDRTIDPETGEIVKGRIRPLPKIDIR